MLLYLLRNIFYYTLIISFSISYIYNLYMPFTDHHSYFEERYNIPYSKSYAYNNFILRICLRTHIGLESNARNNQSCYCKTELLIPPLHYLLLLMETCARCYILNRYQPDWRLKSAATHLLPSLHEQNVLIISKVTDV